MQGGLEVPCVLTLEGDECLMLKTKKLLAFSKKATWGTFSHHVYERICMEVRTCNISSILGKAGLL
jgi:hypothetical protein